MENFFSGENFYPDVEDYIITNDLEKEDVEAYPDDYELRIEESELQPIFQLKMEWVADCIADRAECFDDRFPEDSDDFFDKIKKAVKESVDIEKLNSLLPKLYYPNGIFGKLTKQDLLNAF